MLTFELTDLVGGNVKRIGTHMGGEVTLPWCDSATAKVTLSVRNPITQYVKPLSTMLRVWLDDLPDPVFWGVVLTPYWRSNGKEPSSLEINAHDPTIWWKRNYHRYGDIVVDKGYPHSGKGVRMLHESAIPLPSQIARGIPHPGIIWGTNTAQGYIKAADGTYSVDGDGPRPVNLKSPKTGDGLWSKATRGQNVYDSIQSTQQVVGGPEWRLRFSASIAAGFYAYLDTSRRFGTDKSTGPNTVHFHRGSGRASNCEAFEWSPDGNAVRNYWVEVYPGGEDNRADSQKKALAHAEASWLKYGIYEGWESSGNQDPNSVLLQKAKEFVRYYKEPLDNFNFVPNEDAPQFGKNFILGDVVRGSCADGYFNCDLTGRVRGVTLTQVPKKMMATSVNCVPDVPGTDDVGDPGG